MKIVNQEEILALISKSLEGPLHPEELEILKNWIDESPDNRKYFEQVRNIWEISDRQIDLDKINADEALRKVLGSIQIVSPMKSLWKLWQRIAAIILLPLILGTFLLFYFKSEKTVSPENVVYHEIFTAYGTRTSLRLADSTLVWLNSGSSLKYPDKFTDNSRVVYLRGEGYFEVDSDTRRPFIVKTSNLTVKCTGTHFDVYDYNSGTEAEVTLVKGKLCVNSNNGFDNGFTSELKPGQHLEYNLATGVQELSASDTYTYIAWKDGRLVFHDEPLSEVLKKVSLIFNVDIELQGKELQEYRYHATFVDESLEEILKLLKLSAPINYTEVARKPLADGTFPKKKIIIFPRTSGRE